MFKKRLLSIAVVAAFSTAIIGCGANVNSSQDSATKVGTEAITEVTTEKVKLNRKQIDAMIDRHTRDFMQTQPALATGLNLDESVAGSFQNRLPDYSPAGMKQVQTVMAAAAKELGTIDLTSLSDEDRLHVEVNKVIDEYFAGDLDFPAGYIDTWGGHLPFIVTQIRGPLIEMPAVLQDQHKVKNAVDAKNYVARLEAFAVLVDQVLEKVIADEKAGVILPKKLYPKTLGYLQGFAKPQAAQHSLVTSFVEKLEGATGIDGKLQQMLVAQATQVMAQKVLPAFNRVHDYMAKQQHRAPDEDGIWAQPGGESFYKHEILMLGDSTLTPDAIHQIGLDEVARINKEMDEILRANGRTEGSVGERMMALNDEPQFVYEDSDAGREQLLADLRQQTAEIMVKAPQLFATLPKQEVEVRRVPVVREKGAPGGSYEPPALDGSRPGIYYINLYDMKSNPSYSLKTLTYHEAVPGHHFQIALNMEQQGLGIMRQNGQFNAYVEGWALYSELLAKEINMYEGDPWGDLGRLQAELYRAARLVVDTGLHHKRWPRAKTVDYFYQVTGVSRHDAENEINRYMVWPGQALGYKLGMIKMVELREYAKSELGDKFDIRAFHDLVLLPGSRPLTILEQDVKRWVAKQR